MILQDLRYLEKQKHLDEFYDAETGEIQIRLPVKPKEKYDRPHRQDGTFGAASECKVRQISQELRREAFESLGEAIAKESKRMKLPLSLKRKALIDAHINWLNEKCNGWQLAVSTLATNLLDFFTQCTQMSCNKTVTSIYSRSRKSKTPKTIDL